MIDWFSGELPIDTSDLRLGRIYEVEPTGEITWYTEKWLKCVGSYATSVQIKRESPSPILRASCDKLGMIAPMNSLKLSGNPTKYLQGHNVFGCSATNHNLQALLLHLCSNLHDIKLPYNVNAFHSLGTFPVHPSRIDITVSCLLPSHNDVHNWLKQAAITTRSRHGRPLTSGTSVYWGKHSRRWSLKAYCKFCELHAHPCADRLLQNKLLEYCEPQLRLELTLRSMELKNKPTIADSLLWDYMKKITFGGYKMNNTKNTIANLSIRNQDVLLLWLSGHDVKNRYPLKTFYRMRQVILAECGLDISLERRPDIDELNEANIDLKYLREHQVVQLPPSLQPYCFDPTTIIRN